MIYPMFAMVVLTFIVGLNMLYSRVRAVRERKLSVKYFRAMTGGELPDYAILPARHFTNVFEVPILFYAVCLAAMIMQATGTVMISLAWVFVAARYVQAFIHLTYNNVLHRMTVYFLGFFVVLIMWTMLVVAAT